VMQLSSRQMYQVAASDKEDVTIAFK